MSMLFRTSFYGILVFCVVFSEDAVKVPVVIPASVTVGEFTDFIESVAHLFPLISTESKFAVAELARWSRNTYVLSTIMTVLFCLTPSIAHELHK